MQDWFWWKTEGDPIFNSNFTNVPEELKTLHEEHIHAMISVWGLFDPNSDNLQDHQGRSTSMFPTRMFTMPRIPQARDFYWQNLPGKLFPRAGMRSGSTVRSRKSTGRTWETHSARQATRHRQWRTLYKHLSVDALPGRAGALESNDRSEARLLLTRSAFLGQQRVGATVWSGDVYSTYWATHAPGGCGAQLRTCRAIRIGRPISAATGRHCRTPWNDPKYQELYARWFEYRRILSHLPHPRTRPNITSCGPTTRSSRSSDTTSSAIVSCPISTRLRGAFTTRTTPSAAAGDGLAGRTRRHGTSPIEFMFGPAILVNPVLEAGATHRNVYLPPAPRWYDFWTGDSVRRPGDRGRSAAGYDAALSCAPGPFFRSARRSNMPIKSPAGPIELRI